MENNINMSIERLTSPQIDHQVKAIESLALSGDKRAVKPLISLLRDSAGDWNKRSLTSSIIKALGKLQAKEAQEILLRLLDSNLTFIKADVAESLGRIGPDDNTVNELKEIVQKNDSRMVKKAAIKGLGETKKKEVIKPLADVVEGEFCEEVKEEAIKALGATKKEEAVMPLMIFYYEEANEKLQIDIIEALSQITTTSSLEILLQALSNKNPKIRSCAALSLGELRNASAELPLKNLLSDPEERVRKSAAKALGLITFLPKE